ncbi:LysM peptidoglycan-binding domain-containing protein [Bacillus horti]|uniref:LysM repeat protein n=1 Tax=Caldalkalibacillus horti TaxID=77523 RepID=A0ABT9W0L8_9BACI|nr:LysM peptidoglycan-binding domain-containing protein [Bacillus horti]MDQ0166640.1 LysM repeat protein [Bacillus horti]
MSEYGIWLSFNNQEEGFPLPINPDSIEISTGGRGTTYDISALGEINVIKDPTLTEYSFSGIFPADDHAYPFITAKYRRTTSKYIELIEEWMKSNRPIRFVFTGKSFDINMPASIESFQYKEVAGSGGDLEYSLKLKKYVFYAAKKATVVSPSTGTSAPVLQKEKEPRPNENAQPKTYTLAAGDSLWAVAQKVLGNGARWPEIQQLNGITDAEIKRLPIGKILKLPDTKGGAAHA